MSGRILRRRSPVSRVETTSLQQEYLAALLAADATRARHLAEAAVEAGTSVEDVYLHVLEPALHDIGALWERGEISVAYEHYATSITQGVMGALGPRMRVPPDSGRLAVIACSPGERHALGPAMVADFLESAGWEVLQLGPSLPVGDLVEMVEDEQPDAVCLSTATTERLVHAEETLHELRAAGAPAHLVVGGRAWTQVPDPQARALEMGADACVVDPRELRRLLAERFPPIDDLPADDER